MNPKFANQYFHPKIPNGEEGFKKAVSAVADAAGVNLNAIGNQVANPGQSNTTSVGLTDHTVLISAEGADVWLVSGATQAAVTGANVPVPTAVGTGITGTPVAGLCFKIPANTSQRFCPTLDRPWLGFIGSGAGFISIFKVSE